MCLTVHVFYIIFVLFFYILVLLELVQFQLRGNEIFLSLSSFYPCRPAFTPACAHNFALL